MLSKEYNKVCAEKSDFGKSSQPIKSVRTITWQPLHFTTSLYQSTLPLHSTIALYHYTLPLHCSSWRAQLNDILKHRCLIDVSKRVIGNFFLLVAAGRRNTRTYIDISTYRLNQRRGVLCLNLFTGRELTK